MKHVFLSVLLLLGFAVVASSQSSTTQGDEDRAESLTKISLAIQMLQDGYAEKSPLMLVAAAGILAEWPVRNGADRFGAPTQRPFDTAAYLPVVKISLDPRTILRDARLMASSDNDLIRIIDRAESALPDTSVLDRGRKYSPYAAGYALSPLGSVEIKAVFNGREIAEVFASGNGNTSLDLKIYDTKNRLITADDASPDQCYVTFVPSATSEYRIVIKNRGSKSNYCLLMTN